MLSYYSFCFVAYCVVADESAGRQVPMAFLERVKDDFVSKYGGGKAATAAANSLNKEFGYLISIMKYMLVIFFAVKLANLGILSISDQS